MNPTGPGGVGITGDANPVGNRNVTVKVEGDNSPVYIGAAPPTPPAVSTLHQLPPPPRDFVGRAAELAELMDGMEQGGVTISGLQGMGGVGKTALALVLADRLKARYPDAWFYLDLLGVSQAPLSVAEAMGRVIRAYHPTAQVPDDAAVSGIYQSVLHGQRALLVIDNARDAAQVEPLLPPPSCAVIVTSRRHFTVPGLKPKHLDALPSDDAIALLTRIAPRIGGDARELARRLGYLPYALRLAADFLAGHGNISPPDYLRRLNNVLARPEMGPVEASLSLSYDLLDAEAQRRWCALSVFPDTFDSAAAAAVWGMDSDAAQDGLGDLLTYSLVDWNEATDRYRLHDLARDLAATRLSAADRSTAKRRHATHYETVLADADDLYLQGGEAILCGLKLFDDERANIEAGQAWAGAHNGDDEEATRLCLAYPDAGAYVLYLRQHPRERITWLEGALDAARGLKYRRGESNALGSLGIAYTELGEMSRAIEFHEQHLTIARELGDRRGEGNAIGNLGIAYANLGEARRAIEFYEQWLAITRELSDLRGAGQALGNMGNVFYVLGETRRAIEFYEQCLVIARAISDRYGEGSALSNLGVAYTHLGELRRGIGFYEQALVTLREIGDHRGEGNTLWNLSLSLDILGERAQAIAHAEAAFQIREQLEDPNGAKVREQLAQWRGQAGH